MNKDIEQRAEKAFKDNLRISNVILNYKDGFIAAMTEERERGKRFNVWVTCNEWEYYIIRQKYYIIDVEGLCSYEELFNQFLSEEKALNK